MRDTSFLKTTSIRVGTAETMATACLPPPLWGRDSYWGGAPTGAELRVGAVPVFRNRAILRGEPCDAQSFSVTVR